MCGWMFRKFFYKAKDSVCRSKKTPPVPFQICELQFRLAISKSFISDGDPQAMIATFPFFKDSAVSFSMFSRFGLPRWQLEFNSFETASRSLSDALVTKIDDDLSWREVSVFLDLSFCVFPTSSMKETPLTGRLPISFDNAVTKERSRTAQTKLKYRMFRSWFFASQISCRAIERQGVTPIPPLTNKKLSYLSALSVKEP
mmetsp:Transcript_36992/g.52262  ORF Transcript_36992/g.52262 Transcript_36992/m.52262 type:complete len:200 (-) Transcript_36992:132-731(-)